MLADVDEQKLLEWIEDSLENNTNTLSTGYQGKTLLYKDGDKNLVIKIPHSQGLAGFIHKFTLQHEYRVYQRLSNYQWAPICYQLVNNTYLALEYIDGKPIRDRRPENEQKFMETLLLAIKELHGLGVAHMDLKRKDNLLVTAKDQPYLIDFGTAIIKKGRFNLINFYLFNLARRFDYNAWIKHKYHNNMDNIMAGDERYYRRTLLERVASGIKRLYTGK